MNVIFTPSGPDGNPLSWILNYSSLDVETGNRISQVYNIQTRDGDADVTFNSSNGVTFIGGADNVPFPNSPLRINAGAPGKDFRVVVSKDSINSIISSGRFVNLTTSIVVQEVISGNPPTNTYYYQILTTPSDSKLNVILPNTTATGIVYLRKIGTRDGSNTSQALTPNDVSVSVNSLYNNQLDISNIKSLSDGAIQFDIVRKNGAIFTSNDSNQINIVVTNGSYRSDNNQTLNTSFTVVGNNVVEADPLQIISNYLPNATDDTSYFYILEAIGGTPPYVWKLADNNIIFNGLTLSPFGLVSGKPNGVGSSRFVVNVTDRNGFSVSKTLDLIILQKEIVTPDNPKLLKILGLSNYVARVGENFFADILFEGGTNPYVWTGNDSGEFVFLNQGQIRGLPPGITWKPNGTITGTPLTGTQGAYKFGIEVTSGDGQYDRLAIELGVQGSGGGGGGDNNNDGQPDDGLTIRERRRQT